MLVRDILRVKGTEVLTISPSASLADVVQSLVEHKCGSLVVCEQGRMVGIISERDILRAVAERNNWLENIPVESKMTRNVVTAQPDDPVSSVMGLMTQHRVRHMPIVQDDALVGMISIGDVVKAQHDQLTIENHYLLSYIQS